MQTIINQLQLRFPSLKYTAGSSFYWSPFSSEIFYIAAGADEASVWSLLHETGHAVLEHRNYSLDFELVSLEVSAWEYAKILAAALNAEIDEGHIQDCLDTYRNWLYARSTCPRCSNKGIQLSDTQHYRCFNCGLVWRVAPSRFCRAYRMVGAQTDGTEEITFDQIGY